MGAHCSARGCTEKSCSDPSLQGLVGKPLKRAFRITLGGYQQPSECKVISLQSWGSPAAQWGTLGGLLPESCCCCRGRSGMGLRLLPITKIMMNNEPWLAPIGQEMSENSLVKHCRSNTCCYTPTLQPHQHSQTHMKTHISDTIVPYYAASSHMDNYVIMGGADTCVAAAAAAAAGGGASSLPQLLGYSECGGSPQMPSPIAPQNQPCTPHIMPLQGMA